MIIFTQLPTLILDLKVPFLGKLYLLISDNFLPEKIKYVGNFSRSFIELRERTSPFKRYKAESVIKLNLNSQNEFLYIKTSIQGISYFKFILSALILSVFNTTLYFTFIWISVFTNNIDSVN